MESKELSLTAGGKYRVRIADEDDTIGIFKGYSSLGNEIALGMEIDGGMLRFIPLAQIVYIDQLELPKSDDEPKKVDIYYR